MSITKEQVDPKLQEILSSPYILVLHNDDYNSFEWVIDCLIKVCGHDYDQASQCAILVHYTGSCDVKRGERATLQKMFERLKASGLSVTMEKS